MNTPRIFPIAVSLILGATCASIGRSQTPSPEVPSQLKPLYAELDAALTKATETYPCRPGETLPLVAPNLSLAASIYNPTAGDQERWTGLMKTLDAFQAMGMNGVLVQIMAPDLVWGDREGLLAFYRRLATEVRSRHMKLYVEHFVNLPFVANAPTKEHRGARIEDTPAGRQEFLDILEREVTLIYRELKPDYLSILTEPGAAIVRELHLSLKSDDFAGWVGKVCTELKQSGASPATLLGAGLATFEPDILATKFARQADLDYIDFHVYLMKLNGADQIARLASMIQMVRAVRPAMKLTIGEAWLFKTGAQAPNPAIDEIFLQNNFSFWSPLDQGFLSLLVGVAQQKQVDVIAPFFSQFFFSYYTYGEADAKALPTGTRSLRLSWQKATAAIDAQQLSPTGTALKALLRSLSTTRKSN